MRTLFILIKRNIKLYFKDKGLFFSSLITPIIMLFLYVTFLAKVYKDSFVGAIPETFPVAESLINGCVGGQLVASLIAVSCVTISFCSNLLMISDKYQNQIDDFCVSPTKRYVLDLSYLLATFFSTLIICFVTCGLGFIYLACIGWYISFTDVLLIIVDTIILNLFGTLLSSIIYKFLSTQGQASAAGTIVSAGYGFICGAYMPISQFGKGLQNTLAFLPGTHGTSLLKNHFLNGVYSQMTKDGFPLEVVNGIKDSIDCNLYFFNNKVEIWMMYVIMLVSLLVLLGIYILISFVKKDKKR